MLIAHYISSSQNEANQMTQSKPVFLEGLTSAIDINKIAATIKNFSPLNSVFMGSVGAAITQVFKDHPALITG